MPFPSRAHGQHGPPQAALRSFVALVSFLLSVYFGSLGLLFGFASFTSVLFPFTSLSFPSHSLPPFCLLQPLPPQVPFPPRPAPRPRPATPPRSAPGRCSGAGPPGGALPSGAPGAARGGVGALRLCRIPAGTDGRTVGRSHAPGGDGAAGGGVEPGAGSGASGGASRGMGGVPAPVLLLGGGSEGGRCPVSRCQVRLQRGRVTCTGLGGSGGGPGDG